MKCCKTPNRKLSLLNCRVGYFFLQEPIFVPDPVISLAVEPNNKVKTKLKNLIVAEELGVLLFSL